MANFHSTGWVTGEMVTARAVSATPPYGATGAAVDSATADADGAVDFAGLTEATPYIATGGTSGRAARFQVPTPAASGDGVTVTITGDPTVGEVLTATVSAIVTSPTYQWKRNGSNIVGQTSATYTVRTADIDQEVTCTVAGDVTADSDAVVGLDPGEVPVEELFPGWTVDRTYSLADDDADFVLTNYDESSPGHWTLSDDPDIFATGRILTTDTAIAASEVTVSGYAVPRPGLGITNISLRPTFRYQDASNSWWADRTFSDGAAWIQPVQRIAGTSGGGTVFGSGLNNSDQVTLQHIKTQVFNHFMRSKTWFEGDTEPDWLGVTWRFRPMYGFGPGSGGSADNITETGAAGVQANYGFTITDIVVKVIVPSSANLIANAKFDPNLVDSNGRPDEWSYDTGFTSAETGLVEVVTVAGPDGADVRALHVQRNTHGVTTGLGATQELYVSGVADNIYYTRDRPFPTIGAGPWPATLAWSAWVKGANLSNSGGGTLTARWVNYYSGPAGEDLKTGGGDYHWALGPNEGTGTFGWTFLSGTFTIHQVAANCVRDIITLTLHDDTAEGEMWVYNPSFELVA